MALPVILQYNDCQEEFQLVDKRLHIPTVERVFGLWNAKVDGAIQSADERGFTFGTYMPGSMHEITGTAALPASRLLTLKGVLKQPLAKMCRRFTDRASSSKTVARQARTHDQILEWVDFVPAALSRLEELDDEKHVFSPQIYDQLPSAADTILAAADEMEVRGSLMAFLSLLNKRASDCGLDFEYVGAGSNRSFSFTDLLLRSGNTDLSELSAANWGVIEVKGPWQLDLPDCITLSDAFSHPSHCKQVAPALQQVYGDAVAEEAPVFAISNYNVTFFCHRNLSDVTDKRIWASPPISWDSSLLPPRAAWLHFMAFGQQCRDDNVKCHLLRSSVPLTPKEGYALQNGSQQARLHLKAAWKNGCHVTGSRTPAARAAKGSQSETQQAPCVALAPPSFTMNADATISTASGLLTPELLEAWIFHLPKLSLPDAVFQLPDIDLNNLNLTMECLGSTSLARTMKAKDSTGLLAMKVFDGNNPEAVSTFAQELKAYQKLHELQGQVIPVLRSFGRMAHTGCPAIATCWAGRSMEARHDVSKELLDSAKVALRAIHERHVSHGDVRLQNMLTADNKVVFCDFGQSTIAASLPDFQQDLAMLDDLRP